MRVGINGFGRIGKAIARINEQKKYFDLVMINDINSDNQNLAYQLKYDSTYGTMPNDVTGHQNHIEVDGKQIIVYHKDNIAAVPWILGKVDVIIDASGIHQNVIDARKLQGNRIKNVIVTHSPGNHLVDKSIIMGINEKSIKENDFLISSSICDANAVAPTLNVLDKRFGVSHGFVTTLHPVLGYQNPLDGQSVSFGYPGTTYGRYELGRSFINSLIPKPTSCINATCDVLPEMKDKMLSFSYRVPTTIVSTADLSIKLNKKVTEQEVLRVFRNKIRFQKWKVFTINKDPLVSLDFAGSDYSAIIDRRWLMINNDNYLKVVLWYDNEFGYSSRVVDLVHYLETIK